MYCLSVLVNLPKPTLSKHPEFNPMYVGEKVSFTCDVTVSTGWKYQWYKDRSDRLPETSKTISIQLGPSTGGKYSCNAFRSETTLTVLSEDISLDVLGRLKKITLFKCLCVQQEDVQLFVVSNILMMYCL